MNVFVLIILFYLLYRFIGGFLLPLYRTTRQMRQQFRNMNGHPPSEGTNGTHTNTTHQEQPGNPKPGSSKVGEYIDFEEVK